MENFKQIDKCDVWPYLETDKKVFAAVLKSNCFRSDLYDLTEWDIKNINSLLREVDKKNNTAFFAEVTD